MTPPTEGGVWVLTSLVEDGPEIVGVFTSLSLAMATIPGEWETHRFRGPEDEVDNEDSYQNVHGGFWLLTPYTLNEPTQ